MCFVFRCVLACALGVRYCSNSQYSHCMGPLSTDNTLAASTPIFSVLGLRFVLEHFICDTFLDYPEHRETHYSGGIYIDPVCPVCYSAGHQVLDSSSRASPRHYATFCTHDYAASIEVIAAINPFRRFNIRHLPVPDIISLAPRRKIIYYLFFQYELNKLKFRSIISIVSVRDTISDSGSKYVLYRNSFPHNFRK